MLIEITLKNEQNQLLTKRSIEGFSQARE